MYICMDEYIYIYICVCKDIGPGLMVVHGGCMSGVMLPRDCAAKSALPSGSAS